MKKSIIIAVVSLLVLAFAASLVYAETATDFPPFARNQVRLTDAQRQELAPLFSQMFETKKNIIQKQVEFGNLTQEQADQRITWMKERAEKGDGMMGRGHGMMRGGPGAMGRGHGFGSVTTEKQ